ncbi:23S rRNA (uracil(1939)-C(5))-methyltransferase RlmD [Leptospira sp. GIMC2001]|uniref:23S rRNA (uracil(1939)-C(5))-methyltransferase RlmD n=1 Tax=Leptospira sp. GIMC2001 TaxID=1513297 RepID=UPI0023493E42|nr:23S rRNA (uracil(1939)-C(5))-methyltransferase RlmD [Leptospira sp. GIMC2001]WCL49276.1 23S rRNA (uracil(1939)-C(5))-methyltransferase RlmD [Leptospira sp. GIMC2001]
MNDRKPPFKKSSFKRKIRTQENSRTGTEPFAKSDAPSKFDRKEKPQPRKYDDTRLNPKSRNQSDSNSKSRFKSDSAHKSKTRFQPDELSNAKTRYKSEAPFKGKSKIKNTIDHHQNSDPERKNLCQHFGICSGCTTLNKKYASQLKSKDTKLRDLFQEFRKLTIAPIVPCPEEFHYRFKLQLPFGRKSVGHKSFVTLGLHSVDNRFIVDQAECKIQDLGLTRASQAIRLWARKEKITPYNEKTGNGILRHALIRKSFATGEILVGIILNDYDLPNRKDFSKSLFSTLRDALGKKSEFGKLVGIVMNSNMKNTNMVLGKDFSLLWGRSYLKEKIGPYHFKVGLNNFIQVNPYQTATLYNLILDEIPEKSKVVDAYSGMATIGIWIASKAKEVICTEENQDSFRAGIEAIKMNHIKNVRIKQGRSAEVLPETLAKEDPDVLVLDPPRIGLDEKTIEGILSNPPRKIVYVSCDPDSLLRDSRILSRGYYLTKLTPIDMFPQTGHIETVAVFETK